MEGIVAAVRCRPMTMIEKDAVHGQAVEILPERKQVVVSKERSFSFTHTYSEEATQDQIYNDLVNPVVDEVMKGFNACVMAYGQTGSGKTYTMGTGSKASTPGIVQKALKTIFSCYTHSEIHVSFLEVYKEEVLDLLSPAKKRLHLIDFKPVGLTLVKTEDFDSAVTEMEKGLRNRHTGATNANIHSSRSHAIFTIHFSKQTSDGLCSSKLYLVDLAGCESVTLASGDTRREGLMINKGLLQLGNVMSALSSAGQDHIPYRNSALTSILKDTLSPQNYIVLIACISPLGIDASMTLSTLQFASRVGSIKSNPELGTLLKQRALVTPFKVPDCKRRINSTIATPGSHGKIYRPALRPLNKTIDSPRTPRVKAGNGKYWPTSTPFQDVVKPNFKPTPIMKTKSGVKRRSSSEWDPLDVSTSTVVDSVASNTRVQAQTSLAQNSENETWLRSIIADVIREELKSHTLLSLSRRQDGPSPPKSSKISGSFFDHANETMLEQDEGAVSSSPKQQKTLQTDLFTVEPVVALRRSTRFSLTKSRISQIQGIQSGSPSRNPKINSSSSSGVRAVRRSVRLSVLPRPDYFSGSPGTNNKSAAHNTSSINKSKQSKKAARFSTRFSMLPQVTPENTQKQLNDVVLDILKSGNVKKLQSLPTIGPKTALIISNHRLLHGPIESFKDLENVHGLSTNFTKRFLWANNIMVEDGADSSMQ